MRYSCLLIDHDDTSVDSTPHIHYPAHQEQMRRLNRSEETLNLEDWFRINYHPGLRHYLQKQLKLTEEEQLQCYRIWREYTSTLQDPPFFPGMVNFLQQFTQRGGSVFVVSHSEADIIRGHYERQTDCPGFMPKEIFGWTGIPEQNKPFTWPVDQIQKRYGFKAEEMLMIDDLKPGIIMAQRAAIDSIGVGWSHNIPEIQQDLSAESTVLFSSVKEAAEWVLGS